MITWTERGRLFAPHHADPAPEQIAARGARPGPQRQPRARGLPHRENRASRADLQLALPEGTPWKVIVAIDAEVPSARRSRSMAGCLEAPVSSSSWPIASAAR